jgi:hypothetical protein
MATTKKTTKKAAAKKTIGGRATKTARPASKNGTHKALPNMLYAVVQTADGTVLHTVPMVRKSVEKGNEYSSGKEGYHGSSRTVLDPNGPTIFNFQMVEYTPAARR